MEKLAKKALDIINKKCFIKKEMDYIEEYNIVAKALSKLEAYEESNKTTEELLYMVNNIKIDV